MCAELAGSLHEDGETLGEDDSVTAVSDGEEDLQSSLEAAMAMAAA